MIKKLFAISILLFSVSFAQSDTIITFAEIMFYPASGNNEFIELYNLSSNQSLDLNGFKVKYYTSTADQIVDAGFGTLLPPKSFAVIFENDYDIAAGIYNGLIPSDALILKIADNSFGSSGMANTTSRPLWLLNPANDTTDYYFYSANNPAAISDEKEIMNHDSLATNWANSTVLNGTPGFVNSVTPTNYDLQISELVFSPSVIIAGSSVTINVRVKNKGIISADNYTVEIFNDFNKNSIGEAAELIFLQEYSTLNPDDSVTINTAIDSLNEGEYQIIAKINFAEDQNPANNISIKQFTVVPPGNNYSDLVINEIMYAPAPGEPEWIELYNRTSEPINFKNWKLSDASTSVTLTTEDLFLNANSFIVISRDTTITNFYSVTSDVIVVNIPSLNNTGDAIIIKDVNNVIIDSLYYLPEWGGNTGGKSLERVDYNLSSTVSSNWKTSQSIFKATPGNINSVTQKDFDILVSDIFFNPKYPIIGDNVDVSVVIQNIGKNPANLLVNLYEDENLDSIPDVLIESISDIQISAGDSNLLPFNYLISNIQSKKAFYVKASFVFDQDTTNNYFYKVIEPGYPSQTIVVNEIMFSPVGGEPEWIEFFNNGDTGINIKDWSVSDVITTPFRTYFKDDFIIPAKEYLILTRDSSIINYHRYVNSNLLQMNFAAFNNDRDGIVLSDNRGLTIDSVFYSNQWGGTNGYSIERISSTANSNNQFNWGSSTDIEQSTPGRINSITPKEFDLSVTGISFSPRFPAISDDVLITAKIKNNGSAAAQVFSIDFYIDTDSNNVVDMLLSSVTSSNLNSGDSVLTTSTIPIVNLQRKILTAAKVTFTSDEDTLNNYLERSVEPGFPPDIVKINEVMYNPEDDQAEWIEFVNTITDSINIKNWLVSDVLTTPIKNFITDQNAYISPGEIFLVSKDTSFSLSDYDPLVKIFYSNFGSLGNTNDGVIIYDFRNAIIDSLLYRSSWGGKKGYSLERISLDKATNDSSNWVTSLDKTGSTPGKHNSIFSVPVYDRSTIVINEIMYDPLAGEGEFIELYNLTSDSINIGGWKIEDENKNINKISDTSFFLPPKEFFVLCSDSTVSSKFDLNNFQYKTILNTSSLGLINTGELILLKDARGNVIDSVFYSDKWNNKNIASTKGKSLEKINPDLSGNDPLNWSTSVNSLGGTPRNPNSIFTENLNNASSITINPNPFSPDNDGFEDFAVINYNLTQPIAQVRIKIFDSKGRLVRTLLNNQASGSAGSAVFDGLDDDGNALRIGIYIIFLEALNDNSGVVETAKSVVVIARKL